MVRGALGLLLAALLWLVLLLAGEPQFRRQLARQAALAQRLNALDREAAALDAYRLPFAALAADNPEAVARHLFDVDGTPAIRVETSTPAETLRLHTITVDYENVEYERLVERIRAAEAARPPLKLTACVFEAAPGKTGEGRARLTFEQIEPR
jgi:hypothetical protein